MRLRPLVIILGLLPAMVYAGIRDEIAAMDAAKNNAVAPAFQSTSPRIVTNRNQQQKRHIMALPDGRQADMKDYAIIVFMQAHCTHSAKFDPMLKSWADEHGIKVYPYTLDGGGDVSFPVPLIPRRYQPNDPLAAEIITFFGYGLPIATPTTFVVNVNTLKAYPLVQGETDIPTMESRYAMLIAADMDNLDPSTLAPMPSSSLVTPQ